MEVGLPHPPRMDWKALPEEKNHHYQQQPPSRFCSLHLRILHFEYACSTLPGWIGLKPWQRRSTTSTRTRGSLPSPLRLPPLTLHSWSPARGPWGYTQPPFGNLDTNLILRHRNRLILILSPFGLHLASYLMKSHSRVDFQQNVL